MPVQRNLEKTLRQLAAIYPVVTVTGPRQSGKTTLCKMAFSDRPHVSLEPLDIREYARSDPRGFLSEHTDVVIDEVQHVPELLSYIQDEVDRHPEHVGRFILTGSQHLGLLQGVTQSLAGRSAVLHLLPPTIDELRRFPQTGTNHLADLFVCLWTGAYPRIHDRSLPPQRWLMDYVTTYVQRDVRQVLRVGDLQAFTAFVKLCAGRTGQELNLSALGADAGVSHNTARSWLSVLEAGFLCFRLPAYHPSTRKQLIKAPKIHFFDSGLVCQLLGIREPEQLRHHPLRGPIFESWVVSEVYKAWVHAGLEPPLFHFRRPRGVEVDLVLNRPGGLDLVEIKSAATVASDFFGPLQRICDELHDADERPITQHMVYGGDTGQRRQNVTVLPWHQVDRLTGDLAQP